MPEQANEVVEQTEQQTVEVNPTDTQTNEGIAEADKQPANPDNISLEEWQKDKRYGGMWKNPNDLYKSYVSLEKMHPEIKKNYDTLKGRVDTFSKFLQDNGFDFDNFEQDIEKLKDYRNPESEINQVYNYVSQWLKNDAYKDRVLGFFQQIEAEELQRKYPNMNAEQIQKMQEQEKRIQQIEQIEKQRQEESYRNEQMTAIEKGLSECDNMAKSYGFKITPEVKNYLLAHCSKNGVDTRYIKAEFFNLYGEQLIAARDKKILTNKETNKDKLNSAKILGGGTISNPPAPAKMKGKEAFNAGWAKVFGKKT